MDREAPEIRVDEDPRTGTTIVALLGEHDLATAERLRETVDLLAGEGVIIDLTGCSFIDSSIIAVLLRAAEQHPRLVVQLPATSPLRRALEIVAADRVLALAADRDHALALLAGGGPRGGGR